MPKAYAFFKRDFLAAASYRFNFVMDVGSIFVSTVMFFFLAKLVGPGMGNQLAPYGGDFFAFVLIGIAFSDYLHVSLDAFSAQIRAAQMEGTLEALLVTPTSVPTILLSSSLYSFTLSSIRVMVYLALGALLFGLPLHITNAPAFLFILGLTIAAFCGMGLLSAGLIIVFKQGSPINTLIGVASGLLGGVYYPVAILPPWLEPFSNLLPITHALEAMRQVLLNGASLGAVGGQVLILTLFAAALLPLGLLSMGYGFKVARREGSLIHY
jgi:ABC-2 type transport system permease protein